MKSYKIYPIVILVFLMLSCKTEYERVKASSDLVLISQKANEYYDEGKYLKSQSLLELLIGAYRGRAESEEIYYKYAYTYYHLNQLLLANYYFESFSRTFTNSKYREETEFMAAKCYSDLSPSYRLDQTNTKKAIAAYQNFANLYPESDRLEEVNDLIDAMRAKLEMKQYQDGLLYYNLNEYQAATQTFENLLLDYPDTKSSEQVRYLIVQANYDLADNSIKSVQKERFEHVIDYANIFMNKFPESKHLADVNSMLHSSQTAIKNLSKDGH